MSASPPEPPASPVSGAEVLRDRLRRLGAAGPVRRVDAAPAGRPGAGPHGGVEILRAEFALDRRHGRCVLGEALSAVAGGPAAPGAARQAAGGGGAAEADALLLSGDRLWGLDLSRTVYLDIETTGLAGGTGTYAFLVGLAYLQGGVLVAEQLLLRRLGDEPRLLASLRERLARARHLVTFNGRRFDWPILEARFVLARQQPAPVEDHTDLIRPARWLWHRVLGTHRLSALEAEVVGAPRAGDVPGWLIPAIYVEYLRRGDRAALEPVLAHNRADLLAMVALHGEVARCLRDPHAARVPLDWEGAGVLLARAGYHQEALGCFEQAAQRASDPCVRWRVLRRLARQHRRLGQADAARARWEREAAGWRQPDRFRLHALEEVAKARGQRGDVAGARLAAGEALRLALSLAGAGSSDLLRVAERLRQRLVRLASR
jgi:uncharacterized protein YprB with RNaseH-like and TPR domain